MVVMVGGGGSGDDGDAEESQELLYCFTIVYCPSNNPIFKCAAAVDVVGCLTLQQQT